LIKRGLLANQPITKFPPPFLGQTLRTPEFDYYFLLWEDERLGDAYADLCITGRMNNHDIGQDCHTMTISALFVFHRYDHIV
jgi:hypothetical protein